MRDVIGLPRQGDFGIGGQFDFARADAVVRDRNAANLGVILRRDRNVESSCERGVAADDFRAILEKGHVICVRLDDARLVASRQNFAAVNIAQEDISAPPVASDILTPTRQGDIAPTAIARAGCRDHCRVAAVRQDVRSRHARMRRRVTALNLGHEARYRGSFARLFRRPCNGDFARDAFLQKKFSRLDNWFGMKTRAHGAVMRPRGAARHRPSRPRRCAGKRRT